MVKKDMPADVAFAVFVALREEFEGLFGQVKLTESTFIVGLGTWYEWRVESGTGQVCTGFVKFIGEMGIASSIDLVSRFLVSYSPRVLISFGLSGSLSDDVQLGDVVVADLADIYDASGKIVDDERGSAVFQPSGIQVRTDAFKDLAQNFQFAHSDEYSRWQESTKTRRTKEGVLGEMLRGNSSTQVHIGRVACGSNVVASKAYRDLIKGRDRRYLAVDMESAGIAFTALSNSGNQPKVLIVRAVSDNADPSKNASDRSGERGPGSIRRWALGNASSFLALFLPLVLKREGLFRDSRTITQVEHPQARMVPHGEFRPVLSGLHKDVLDSYATSGASGLKEFDSFFQHFVNYEPAKPLFEYILNTDEPALRSGSQIVTITGRSGSGKSAILSCLYLTQSDRYQRGLSKLVPLLFDLRASLTSSSRSDEDVAEHFGAKLRQVISLAAERHSPDVLLFIDNYEEYLPTTVKLQLVSEVQRTLKSLSNGSLKVVVSVGLEEDHRFLGEEAHVLHSTKGAVSVALHRISVSDIQALEAVVASYECLRRGMGRPLNTTDIKALLHNLGAIDLDFFVLNLIAWAEEQGSFLARGEPKVAGLLGNLYRSYCMDCIRKRSSHESSEQSVHMAIADIASLAYKRHLSYEDATLLYSSADVSLELILDRHQTIRDFLVAEHIINCLVAKSVEGLSDSTFVYPVGIARFISSNINSSLHVQKQVLDSVQQLYQSASVAQRSQMCYLLGNLNGKAIQPLLKNFLLDRYSQCREQLSVVDNSMSRLLLYRLERSIILGLAELNTESHNLSYLRKLVVDDLADSTNRRSLLEQYGDVTAIESSSLDFDDTQISPERTLKHLIELTHSCVEGGPIPFRALTDIHGLTSIAVHRHLNGDLEPQMLHSIHCLVEGLLRSNSWLRLDFYESYLEMSREILEREGATRSSILRKLLSLKRIKREGWNASVRIGEGRRRVPHPESVADHIFGCLVVAEMFLPDVDSTEGYDKAEIMRMLLIHDLGEVETGDIVHINKTQADRLTEDKVMRRLAALGSIGSFQSLHKWRELWGAFEARRGVNGSIAADIDYIECYVQLGSYLLEEGVEIPDSATWAHDLELNIKTDQGRRILELLKRPK